MKHRVVSLFSCVLLTGSLVGCGKHTLEAYGEHASFVDHLQEQVSLTPDGGLSSEPYLMGMKHLSVEGFDSRPPFYVTHRTKHIKHFPCMECHTRNLEQLKSERSQEKRSHWDVELKHASVETMNCVTCHAPQDMNVLRTLNSRPIDYNHSYLLCAQCHFAQAKDWAGGAHGKRVGGWAPPRVVKNCTECHNPHKPGLEKRWPVRASRMFYRERK